MKKITIFLLLIWLSVCSYGSVLINGIQYDLDTENLTASVAENDPSLSGAIVIPSTVQYQEQTYSVTSIGYKAFEDCSQITSFSIPNSITTIGDRAFMYCNGLTSITIPNSVTSIGYSVFERCSYLVSVTLPDSLISLGSDAFYACSSLTSVNLPDGITRLEQNLLRGCSSLTSVTIPNSVTDIDFGAFHTCTNLVSVTISSNINTIGPRAFRECYSLRSVDIPNSATSIGYGAFELCYALDTVTIGTGVNYIGENSFDNSNLSQLTINADSCFSDAVFFMADSSTIIIGSGVRNLTNVHTISDSTTNVFSSAIIPPVAKTLTFSEYLATLHVPYTSINNYHNTYVWKNFNIEGTGTVYTVNVLANDSAMGAVEGNGIYGENQSATLRAMPNIGFAFNGWTDGASDNPRTLSVTKDSTLTAIFSPMVSDTIYFTDTLYVTEYLTDTVYLEYDGGDANQYSLEDYGVYYFMNRVVNPDGIYLKLYAMDGKLLKKGTDDFDMSDYPNGIYIVTDGKGGFLKINHFRQ